MSASLSERYATLLEERLLDDARLPDWAGDLRRQALEQAMAIGFPHRRHEDWKYTRTPDLAREAMTPASGGGRPDTSAIDALAVPDAILFVLVDGAHVPALSRNLDALPDGVLRPLAAAIREDSETTATLLAGDTTPENVFGGLAAAFALDGAVLNVPANSHLDRPIQVVHFASREPEEALRLVPSRLLVTLGRQARATLIETFAGEAGPHSVLAHAASIRVAAGARLDHLRWQATPTDTRVFAHVEVDLQRDAAWHGLALTTGGRLSREDLRVSLNDTGAHADLAAIVLGDGNQHHDHNTLIDHRVPHCTSDQLYKNVLAGQGHAVFHGKIHVRPDAQKTAAFQLNRSLLLSEKARVDTRPQLEIFADDVKCSHGATIGRLQEEELFYLQSRAVPPATARRLLVRGFALDVLERIANDRLRTWCSERLERHLDTLS